MYAVTLDPGQAIAMRARDGKVLWTRPLSGRSETSPMIVGKNVVVGSESGTVYSLDRDSGQIDWQVSTAGAVKGGLALDDGVLYGANYAGQVFALRASSGSFVWQSSTQGLSFGRGGPVYSTPAVAFGRVYLGSIDGRVYSFDADNGELLWSHSTGDWVYAGPAVADTKRIRSDRLRRLQGSELLRARRRERRGALAEGPRRRRARRRQRARRGRLRRRARPEHRHLPASTSTTGKKVFESELGEYNPVISDGNRLYLTGYSNVRAFEHQTKAQRKREARPAPARATAKRRAQKRQRAAGQTTGQ